MQRVATALKDHVYNCEPKPDSFYKDTRIERSNGNLPLFVRRFARISGTRLKLLKVPASWSVN